MTEHEHKLLPVAFEFECWSEGDLKILKVTIADTKNFILLSMDSTAGEAELEMVVTMIRHASDLLTGGVSMSNSHSEGEVT